VDNSLPRVLAHTHCATTTAFSSRNPMVDPKETLTLLLFATGEHLGFIFGKGTVNVAGNRRDIRQRRGSPRSQS